MAEKEKMQAVYLFIFVVYDVSGLLSQAAVISRNASKST